jgi:beta-xylosidase
VAILAAIAGLSQGTAGCGRDATPPPVAVDEVPASPIASLQDDRVYQYQDVPGISAAERQRLIDERIKTMADLGGALIRVDFRWDKVAVREPRNPRNPDDPAYDWDRYDRIVAAAKTYGVELLFTVWGTPAWAADPSIHPSPNEPWAVRPRNPDDYGAFAAAAARRYASLGVRKWEAWNEPNIPLFLIPQYERRGARWVATSPATYSDLLKRFYANVKRVAPNVVVAGAVTAPTGDDCGLSCSPKRTARPARVAPAAFLQGLDTPELRPPMDVVSHHPYPTIRPELASRPRPRAIELYNLEQLTAAIDRTYLRGRPIWLSEYGFATEPVVNLATFLTPAEQATAISDALRRVREVRRVQLMTYYFLQDNQGFKSGLTELDGTPKPGRDAFAMPLFADPAGEVATGARVRIVGQARPATGRSTVEVEWRSGDAWKSLKEVRTLGDGTFGLVVTAQETLAIRARWSGTTRSGASAEWTSPTVTIPVRTGASRTETDREQG